VDGCRSHAAESCHCTPDKEAAAVQVYLDRSGYSSNPQKRIALSRVLFMVSQVFGLGLGFGIRS
jgi:hypothetical protein